MRPTVTALIRNYDIFEPQLVSSTMQSKLIIIKLLCDKSTRRVYQYHYCCTVRQIFKMDKLCRRCNLGVRNIKDGRIIYKIVKEGQ